MAAVMLSRVIGFVRELYIARTFGAGPYTDAYNAAFTLPDFLNYILAGGVTSITFISIYTRYRAQGREEDANRTFSTIICIVSAAFIVFALVAAIFTRPFVEWFFKGFTPEQVDLCTAMTRVVLPAQLFFYVGGIVSAVLQSRRMFLLPALGPLLYNLFIILGGLLGARRLGVESLAIGALAGAILGPFLVNILGARKTEIGFRLSFDFRDAGFREWFRLTVPLMLGFSLVTVDDWFLRHFASGAAGEISRLNYAKRLFLVPIAVLGQAAGMASLPFFTRLFGEGKRREFVTLIGDSVTRLASVGMLLGGWMIVAALPVVDLAYRRGHFTLADSHATAVYFAWFALSLPLWSAQALYTRAFYASGDTVTPMIGSTLVTVASYPLYGFLMERFGIAGLAIASDAGIAMNTAVIIALLKYRGLVPLGAVDWSELTKGFGTAAFAAGAAFAARWFLQAPDSRTGNVLSLITTTLVWAIAAWVGIKLTGSKLPLAFRRGRQETPAADGAV